MMTSDTSFFAQLAQRLVFEYGEDKNSPWVWGLVDVDPATKEGKDFLLLLTGYLIDTHGVSSFSPLVRQLVGIADGDGLKKPKAGISRRKIGRFGQKVKTISSEGT